MPLCTLYLLTLSSPLSDFLALLAAVEPRPLVTSKVIRWIITPSHLTNPLLLHPWDLLLIYPTITALPPSLHAHTTASYTITAGIPSSLVSAFPTTNPRLLHPPPNSVPALTGALDEPLLSSSAQNLELTKDLREWITTYDPNNAKGCVSMLNLLSFHPGKHEQYLRYGKAFSESIGSRRGGVAKVVGKVVPEKEKAGNKDEAAWGWEEVALAHYPSIWHFADMAASRDYQEVNQRERVGSLRDTCILMTSELAVEAAVGRARL